MHDTPSEIICLFMNDIIQGMVEAKYYLYLDILFPFVAVNIDSCTGIKKFAPPTTAYTVWYK